MLKGISSATHSRGDNLRFILLFSLAYPFAVAAEAIKRGLAATDAPLSRQSLFSEARESTSIAISYAVMAKTTLKRSTR